MRARLLVVGWAASCAVLFGGCAPHRDVLALPGGGSSSPVFSAGIQSGDLLFLSGVVGRSESGDIPEATRSALDGIRERMEAAGGTMEDIVQCTVFMIDIGHYQAINDTYVQYFPGEPPARTAVSVVAVPADGQMEIACIAAAP
jgi:2-iminobutanoate/2-iminopropanoate deaminase